MTAVTNAIALHWSAVHKCYGATVALDGLTLAVPRGQVFGLLGPNGAGKSTSLHLACGLLQPDRGEVRIGGDTPTSIAARRRLGLAPQKLALYDALSGRENLEFFGRLQGLSGATLAQRVDHALAFVGLTDRQRDRAGGYSGGMARRLNLAVALVHDPELLLLDEPTAGVDPQSRNALFEHVQALRTAGKTIVYTTHYMEEVEKLCDRVAIVDHGRVIAEDTVAGLIAAHGGPPTLIVRRAGVEERIVTDDPLRALTAAAAAGDVDDFRTERPTLEQVFLNLTGRHLRD